MDEEEPCEICEGMLDTDCDGDCWDGEDCPGWHRPDHCCGCGGTPYCRCPAPQEPVTVYGWDGVAGSV